MQLHITDLLDYCTSNSYLWVYLHIKGSTVNEFKNINKIHSPHDELPPTL